MKRFFKNCHLPDHLEVLFMLILGILLQVTDGSPFSMKEKWMLVWETELPAEYFSLFVQKFIKTILSMIVIVRCATTYAYVVSAMLVIFCLLKKSAPKLMLLWLLVAAVKSVCMTFLEALAGVYVCSAFGKIRKACIEFFISKALEIIFATYLWGNVLNIYQDIERKAEEDLNLQANEQFLLQKMDFGRQRARSLLDESTLYKTACLNNFEFKDVPQIILQMLRRDDEMSEDSLLGPGMMLASVSNLGSFDNLKASQSLGELGFTDLRTTQVVGLEDDENLSYRDKALRFLKLTMSDVRRIQLSKSIVENDIYAIDEEIWTRLMASGTHINKPKQARTEVFIREIIQPDEENIQKIKNQNTFDFKFGFSFSNLFNEKPAELQDDQDEDESLIFSQDEEEGKEDDESTQLFMSNIKEGAVINRYTLGFAFNKMKGNEYAELYKQDFMSAIGPEVFDRATKLPKVTSLTKITRNLEPKKSASLPAFQEVQQISQRKINFRDFKEKILEASSSDVDLRSSEGPNDEDLVALEEAYSGGKINNQETKFAKDELDSPPQTETKKAHDEKRTKLRSKEENLGSDSLCLSESSKITDKSSVDSVEFSSAGVHDAEATKERPCFKKRRVIIIRRVGRQKSKAPLLKLSSDNQRHPENFDGCSDVCSESNTEVDKEDAENHDETEVLPSDLETRNLCKDFSSRGQTLADADINQIYFLVERLQEPLLDVLITHWNLEKRLHAQRKAMIWPPTQKLKFLHFLYKNYHLIENEKMLHPSECGLKKEKTWKSKVLKSVEIWKGQYSPMTFRSFLNIIKKKSVMNKLIKYEYFYLKNKHKNFISAKNEILPLQLDVKYRKTRSNSNTETAGEKCTPGNSVDGKAESKIECNFQKNLTEPCIPLEKIASEEHNKDSENLPVVKRIHSASSKIGKLNAAEDENSQSSESDVLETNIDFEELNTEAEDIRDTELQEKFDLVTVPSETLASDPEEGSLYSQESDEPISLYYSKAANLASPLLDMKRFIYPDHIHYSYKHVKKKGFDVDISGGFPLLVRENLTMSTPVNLGNESASRNAEFKITRRPMDLSFATTNAFVEWQNNDQNDADCVTSDTKCARQTSNSSSRRKEGKIPDVDLITSNKGKRMKLWKRHNNSRNETLRNDLSKSKSKFCGRNFNDIKYLYSARDYALVEKLLKMHMQFNKTERKDFENIALAPDKEFGSERTPVQISSTQLHSNKGRKNSTYNPAIFLQENKTRNEKKKIETQEKRTKDMFARLEREALLQSKNVQKSFNSNWNS